MYKGKIHLSIGSRPFRTPCGLPRSMRDWKLDTSEFIGIVTCKRCLRTHFLNNELARIKKSNAIYAKKMHEKHKHLWPQKDVSAN